MQTKSTAGTATAWHGRRGEHELPAPKLAVEKEVFYLLPGPLLGFPVLAEVSYRY